MPFLFMPFTMHQQYYVYDANTNSLVIITPEQYQSLKTVLFGKATYEDSSALEKLQQMGYCKETKIVKIEHPYTKTFTEMLDRRISRIILQVTQKCNLRCSYCAYSGLYKNRTHSHKSMPFEIAFKGIDYLMEHSVDTPEVNIGFYGGEPLLEMELMQQCFKYVAKTYPGRSVSYALTTNGTLLTPKLYSYLRENDVNILISLISRTCNYEIVKEYEKNA